MTTPFAIFRKNQKALIAILGVLCIFVFTVGSIVLDFFDVGRAPVDNKVVVEWKGGKITASELQRMQVSHNLLVAYLDAVIQETVDKKGTPKAPGLVRNRFGQYVDPGIRRSSSERDVVQTMVLAKKAEEAGLVVSDEAVDSFLLRQLGDEMLGSQTMTELLQTATRGQLRRNRLYDLLKTELLAQNLQVLAQSGMFATPPAEAWQYYNELNRRVTTEMLPIPVDAFLDQVADPSKAEVLALYEERKNQTKSPETPVPGFKRGDQIKFGYFRSNMDDFKSQLTEEEIVAYYEANKEERFKNLTLPENPAEKPATEDAAPPKDAAEKDAAAEGDAPPEKPATEGGDKNKDAETTKEAKPAAAPEEKNPPVEKPGEKPADSPTKADKKKVDQDQTGQDKEEAAKPKSADGAANDADNQTFVAFTQEEETPEDKTGGDAKTEGDKSTKKETGKDEAKEKKPPQEDAAPKPEEKPQDAPPQKSATVPPTTVPPTTVPPTTVPPTTVPPTQPATPPAAKPADETEPAKKPIYKPLTEVRSQVENALSQQKATEAFNIVGRLIGRYARNLRMYQAKKSKGQTASPPQQVDFAAVAKEYGLTYGETPLADRFAVEETELGKTYAQSFSATGIQTIPFVAIAYRRGTPLYKTAKIGGERFTEYLYWKISEKEAYVPALEEVQEEVVRVWKMEQALPLAKKFASELAAAAEKQISQAEKAAAAKKTPSNDDKDGDDKKDDANQDPSPEDTAENLPTLADVVNVLIQEKKTNLGVLQDLAPPPFSWMTTGAMPYGFGGAPELSSVEGVYGVDNTFMKAVFSLHVGEVGVAVNHPKTVTYLTRVTGEAPPKEQRRLMFTFSAFNPNTQQLANGERSLTFRRWYQELEKSYDVKWNRPADQEQL